MTCSQSLRWVGVGAIALLLSVSSCGGGGGGGSDLCTPGGSFPAGIVHGPQVSRPTPTSVVIAFWSEQSVVGAVDYGPTALYGTTATASTAATAHAIALGPLTPSTTYHYRVLLGATPVGVDHTFTTPPASFSTPVRFVALGDTGTGCTTEYEAIAAATAQGPDFVLHTGDAAYTDGTSEEVLSRFIVPFADVMASTPVFTTIGNHDSHTLGGQPLLDAQALPANPSDPSSRFYSFDWGACHVACLDSEIPMTLGTVQNDWLRADLAASSAPWTFVVVHRPPYSASKHGSNPELQADLVPILDLHHVDVVLSGHEHGYERTLPLVAGTPVDVAMDPDFVDPAGTVYVVTGGGGQTLYPSGTSAFTALSVSSHHVTLVEVDGLTLTLTAIGVDGTVLDRSTITKSP